MKYFNLIKPHLLAIVIFISVTMAYFFPLLEGKDVQQSDMTHAVGMAQELKNYHDTSGKYSQWTNSMFSGMPAYHVGPHTANNNIFSHISGIIGLGLSFTSAGIVLAMLISFYFLLLVMGVNPWISIAGAVAYAFSTYNFVIIGAGHVTKAWALAYIPIIIAGTILLYRKKYLFGFLVSMLGIGLNLSRNHIQVTYYSMFITGIIILGFLIEALRSKEYKSFLFSTLLLIAATLLSLLPNANMLYTNYEISKTSIRGPSELTQKDDSKKGGGLDKDYAFSWSYGKMETFSILIPNFMGGASGSELTTDSELYKTLQQNGVAEAKQYIKQTPTYWGDMPFTSGPAYHGAIICFLFILGLYIIKSNLKWWLLAATILSFFLAWGRNFEIFNDLMFYYFPMYSKFRTVSMALVIAQFTMPFLAILAVWEFISNLEDKARLLKGLKWSLIITGGLCLFFALLGGALFDFTAPGDAQIKTQVPDWYYNALLADRAGLLRSDAFRSLMFIVLAGSILWAALKNNKIIRYVAPLLIFFILADLWTIDKRYLNSSSFVRKNKKYEFNESAADKLILQDKDLSYRVLNLNNPINEVNTSYFHKSIGGYHGAKQRRYQELIENHIQPEMSEFIKALQSSSTPQKIDSALKTCGVLNMLNTRYIIYNPEAAPLMNNHALGNAWFVKEYKIVENADQEMNETGLIDPLHTAIIDKRFADKLKGFRIQTDSSAGIKLISYKPNELQYDYTASTQQLAVFSEVYYSTGWKASIDGKEISHFRADWILRAMLLPEGKHRLVFSFEPREYKISQNAAISGSFLIGILLIAGIVIPVVRKKRKTE